MTPKPHRIWIMWTGDTDLREAVVLLSPLFSAQDRGEAARFRFEKDQHQFLMARALVRLALSEEVTVAPNAWRFCRNERSRPYVAAPRLALPLWFSISHTNGLVACLVSALSEAAIDVEKVEQRDGLALVAREAFSPSEQEALARLAGRDWTRRFFAHWTLKEAYAKARGLGIGLGLDEIAFNLPETGAIGVRISSTLEDDLREWKFRTRDLGADHMMSVAARVGTEAPLDVDVRTIGLNGTGLALRAIAEEKFAQDVRRLERAL